MKNKMFKMSLMLLFSIFSIIKTENTELIDSLLEEGYWGLPNGICDKDGCLKPGAFIYHAGIKYGSGDKVPYIDPYKEIERKSLSIQGENDSLAEIVKKKFIKIFFNYSYPNFLSQYKNLQQNKIDKIKKNIKINDNFKEDIFEKFKKSKLPYINDFYEKTIENDNFLNLCFPNENRFNQSLNDWGQKFTDNGWNNSYLKND